MNGVLYGDMGLHGNTDDYYDPRNVLVDQVLERRTGMPISLCVVYLLCAHRLGIACRGVNYPGHFVLSVEYPRRKKREEEDEEEEEKKEEEKEEEPEKFYVDAFESGKRMRTDQLTDGDLTLMEARPIDVFFRILRNLLSIVRNPMHQHASGGDERNRLIQRRCYALWLAMEEAGARDGAGSGSPVTHNVKKGLSQVYLELNVNHDFVLEHAHLWDGPQAPNQDVYLSDKVRQECKVSE